MSVYVNTSNGGSNEVELDNPLRFNYHCYNDSPIFTYSTGFSYNGFHYIEHSNYNLYKYNLKDKTYTILNTGKYGNLRAYSKLLKDDSTGKGYNVCGDNSLTAYIYVFPLNRIDEREVHGTSYLVNGGGWILGQYYPVIYNSKIYTFGGILGNNSISSTIFEIDLSTTHFTGRSYAVLPIALRYPNGTFDGVETVYITGGSTSLGNSFSDKFFKFNLRTKEYKELPTPGHGASGFGGYLNYIGNGKIFYAYGQGPKPNYCEIFYIEENKWVRTNDGFSSSFAANIYEPTEDAVHIHGGYINGGWNNYHIVHKI